MTSIVLGSGINTDYFCSSSSNKKGKDGRVFLLIARMLRDKGVNEFVEAARLIKEEHSDVRFQLLGPVDVENNTAISQTVIDGWVAEGVVEYLPLALYRRVEQDDPTPMLDDAIIKNVDTPWSREPAEFGVKNQKGDHSDPKYRRGITE